jgi:hypothetical protein
MEERATGPRPEWVLASDARRAATDSSPRLAPLVEGRGVLRDVVAAVRNLEDLLRSPRVGPRALAQVIPELKGFNGPLLVSVDQILQCVQEAAELPVDEAVMEVGAYVHGVGARLHDSLERALGAALDAKTRLSFESSLAQAGAELNSVRQLLDLLIHATERLETDLDLEEVIDVAFSAPSGNGRRTSPVRVIASYQRDGSEFRASAGVLVPLVTLAVALAPGHRSDPVFAHAVCRAGEPVVVSLDRDCPAEGDEYSFEPPFVVSPSLVCAQTAARLAAGSLAIEGNRVVMTWRQS